MKKFVGVTTLAALFAAGSAFANDTTDLTVQANVLGFCTFDQAGYLMDFGDLDPIAGGDVSVTTTIDFSCSPGSSYAIDNISGLAVMPRVLGGDNLPYTISPYATTGVATGVLQSLDLVGTVFGVDYVTASGRQPGAYQAVRAININP
jgi:spore coat protein U-like protein